MLSARAQSLSIGTNFATAVLGGQTAGASAQSAIAAESAAARPRNSNGASTGTTSDLVRRRVRLSHPRRSSGC
jgi:hypothetical protein